MKRETERPQNVDLETRDDGDHGEENAANAIWPVSGLRQFVDMADTSFSTSGIAQNGASDCNNASVRTDGQSSDVESEH